MFETVSLILTYLTRVSLNTIQELLERHSLEDGFNDINPKLVEFLRSPGDVLPSIIQSNEVERFMFDGKKEYEKNIQKPVKQPGRQKLVTPAMSGVGGKAQSRKSRKSSNKFDMN